MVSWLIVLRLNNGQVTKTAVVSNQHQRASKDETEEKNKNNNKKILCLLQAQGTLPYYYPKDCNEGFQNLHSVELPTPFLFKNYTNSCMHSKQDCQVERVDLPYNILPLIHYKLGSN